MQEIVYHTNYKLEDTYWWFIARNLIVGKIIDRICGLNKGDQLLDVGVGTGGFASFISDRFDVIGLDTSEIALEYCKKRGLENLFLGTLDKFPAERWNIKAVTMLDVVEHIEDDQGVVDQVYELLPAGGCFIAAVPAYQWMWSIHDKIHMHYRRYNRKTFLKLLRNSGFEIEFHSYFNTFLFLPAVLKRFLGKIGGEKEPESPVDDVSPFLNKLFTKIFSAERYILPTLKFPFGVSFIAVGKKK